MLFRQRRTTEKRRGVAAVELALLLPFLLFIWVIAIDWARIFYYTTTLMFSSRDGAYFASNYPGIYSYSNAQQAALGETSNLSPDPTVTVTTSGGYTTCSVTWTFNTVTRFPVVPSSTDITRQTVMRVAPITPSF